MVSTRRPSLLAGSADSESDLELMRRWELPLVYVRPSKPAEHQGGLQV